MNMNRMAEKLVVSWKLMNLRMHPNTLRPHLMADTMEAKLSSSSTIAEASFATSVPLRPMENPTSAFFNAGASFTMVLAAGRAMMEEHVLAFSELSYVYGDEEGTAAGLTFNVSQAAPLDKAPDFYRFLDAVLAGDAAHELPRRLLDLLVRGVLLLLPRRHRPRRACRALLEPRLSRDQVLLGVAGGTGPARFHA